MLMLLWQQTVHRHARASGAAVQSAGDAAAAFFVVNSVDIGGQCSSYDYWAEVIDCWPEAWEKNSVKNGLRRDKSCFLDRLDLRYMSPRIH